MLTFRGQEDFGRNGHPSVTARQLPPGPVAVLSRRSSLRRRLPALACGPGLLACLSMLSGCRRLLRCLGPVRRHSITSTVSVLAGAGTARNPPCGRTRGASPAWPSFTGRAEQRVLDRRSASPCAEPPATGFDPVGRPGSRPASWCDRLQAPAPPARRRVPDR